jgi:dTDP-4-amino-4,6-dideoxygalactose transaminase
MSDQRGVAIPQANPGAGYLKHKSEIDAAMARVGQSGRYILGPEVDDFEREFAAYIGTAHAIGVASGTDAIELALRGAEIGAGDLVFTVAQTAVATVAAVERAGAIPVLVDIDPITYTMDPAKLDAALRAAQKNPALRGARPAAVIPVHLYGQAADLPAILEIARRAGMIVIEDCAQCHGASLDGRRLGAWGSVASFSFYPTKNLAAIGDGGMIASNDARIAKRIRALRQYGWEERYISSIRGGNSRLDELQAAILRTRLTHLEEDNDLRRKWAAMYDAALEKTALLRPVVRKGARHVYHQYVVRSPSRESLREHLVAQQIGSAIHYPVPIHLQPAYQGQLAGADALPNTEAAAREILSLPMFPELTTEQVTRVAKSVQAWAAASAAA